MTRKVLAAAQAALGGSKRRTPKRKSTKKTRQAAKVSLKIKGSPSQVKQAVKQVTRGAESGSGQSSLRGLNG